MTQMTMNRCKTLVKNNTLGRVWYVIFYIIYPWVAQASFSMKQSARKEQQVVRNTPESRPCSACSLIDIPWYSYSGLDPCTPQLLEHKLTYQAWCINDISIVLIDGFPMNPALQPNSSRTRSKTTKELKPMLFKPVQCQSCQTKCTQCCTFHLLRFCITTFWFWRNFGIMKFSGSQC